MAPKEQVKARHKIIASRIAAGDTKTAIAKDLGITRQTVYDALAKPDVQMEIARKQEAADASRCLSVQQRKEILSDLASNKVGDSNIIEPVAPRDRISSIDKLNLMEHVYESGSGSGEQETRFRDLMIAIGVVQVNPVSSLACHNSCSATQLNDGSKVDDVIDGEIVGHNPIVPQAESQG